MSSILDSHAVIARLRATREAKGLSAQQVADKTGIARSVIANLENGRRGSITLDEARLISEALGVDLRVVLSDEPMPIAREVWEV